MTYRSKIILLDERFPTGEPTVQLISTWGRGGRLLRETTSLSKTASHSPAEDYVRSIEPEPGKTTVLIVGLGDHETYGPNRNGDGFPSEPVRGKIAADEVLPRHYKTYENAHVFEHHANSDPEKAIGRVKKAFWNPHMRRVEVIEDFDHNKAPGLLEKIASGEYPAKSMGCRIKYDVCTDCGNRARTRKEYCDHLKYEMGKIASDTGVQYAALNPSPNFFDSSWVIRPADRTGYMLKKVARVYEISTPSYELGEMCDDITAKAAAMRKAGDIEKIIGGEPAASVSNLDDGDARLLERYTKECPPGDKPNSKGVVRMMISYKPSEALGTADDMGLPLGIGELLKYFLGRMNPGKEPEVEDSIVKSASRHVGLIYQIFSEYPRFYDTILKLGHLEEPTSHSVELAEKLAAYTPSSVTEDYLYRQAVPESFRGNERGLTDMVSWTDPNTGQSYETNYGTVQKTHDALARQALMRKGMDVGAGGAMLGGGALLGAGALGMGLSKKLRGLPQLAVGAAGLGLGALGAQRALRSPQTSGPRVRTDQGETISGWTEMLPKRASVIAPEIMYTRRRSVDGPVKPLPTKYAADFIRALKIAEVQDEMTPFLGPNLDLDRTAQALGTSIVKWAE